jgi:hypothetical protein
VEILGNRLGDAGISPYGLERVEPTLEDVFSFWQCDKYLHAEARADILLVERGLVDSRAQAQRLVMAARCGQTVRS